MAEIRPEEAYARTLNRDLIGELSGTLPKAEVAISGAGVHWKCVATREDRSVSVSCFQYDMIDHQGAEFYLHFRMGAATLATGRTPSSIETVRAVRDWLDDVSLLDIYERFAFVDEEKREQSALLAELIELCPELARSAMPELRQTWADSYELWFTSHDRSCRLYYDAIFHWDLCPLFQCQTSDAVWLADLIKCWLCDYLMPSKIQDRYPQIEMSPVARYYENGQPLIGEFLQSWDKIAKYFETDYLQNSQQILAFIGQLRQAGYDQRLRAGQSLYAFVVSRSRRHGLREDQPSLAFVFGNDSMTIYGATETPIATVPYIELTPLVDGLLKQLAAASID